MGITIYIPRQKGAIRLKMALRKLGFQLRRFDNKWTVMYLSSKYAKEIK